MFAKDGFFFLIANACFFLALWTLAGCAMTCSGNNAGEADVLKY